MRILRSLGGVHGECEWGVGRGADAETDLSGLGAAAPDDMRLGEEWEMDGVWCG